MNNFWDKLAKSYTKNTEKAFNIQPFGSGRVFYFGDRLSGRKKDLPFQTSVNRHKIGLLS